jgi:hypothetical protein
MRELADMPSPTSPAKALPSVLVLNCGPAAAMIVIGASSGALCS